MSRTGFLKEKNKVRGTICLIFKVMGFCDSGGGGVHAIFADLKNNLGWWLDSNISMINLTIILRTSDLSICKWDKSL